CGRHGGLPERGKACELAVTWGELKSTTKTAKRKQEISPVAFHCMAAIGRSQHGRGNVKKLGYFMSTVDDSAGTGAPHFSSARLPIAFCRARMLPKLLK